MDQVAPAVQFIRKHAPELNSWTDESLVAWVSFAIRRKRLICVYDADSVLVGIGAARCLTDRQDSNDWYAHDESGETVFVDLVVGEGVMPVLWEAMGKRYGKRQRVAFRRFRDERRRDYDMQQFDKHLKRHHGK